VELARAVDADGMVGAVDAALPEHAATTSTSAAKRTAIGPRVARAGWTGTNTGESPPRAGSAGGGAGRGAGGARGAGHPRGALRRCTARDCLPFSRRFEQCTAGRRPDYA